MNDKLENILRGIKQAVVRGSKRLLMISLPIVLIIIIIISAAVYLIKKHDGTYEEGDWANTQYAAGQYTGNTSIDSNGNITTNMSAQELWDKLMEEGSRVDLYLDGPEELLKLMNAEIVTNYPDLRSNPDDPIDWDTINSDLDSKDIQGIIKFKRAQTDGTTSTMSYVDSDTFYNWIELYCSTGDESAKQNALTHFTIEKNMTMGSGATDTLEYNGSDIVTDISERIIAAAKITPWPGASLCQAWVRAVYANAGLGDVAYAKAVDAYRANVVSTEMDNIPIGAAVYGTGTGAYGAGHVGIYIGNGQVMDSVGSGIRTQSLQEWVAWQENYGFVVDGRTGWLGWGWQSGSPTKIISGGDEKDDADDEDKKDDDEEVSTVDMQLITDNGKVTFYNGDGSAMEGGKLNAINYELTDGQVAMKNLQQYKNCVIYIETAETGEGSYANGKFFYVTDTGGGLADNQVDVYADVDQATLNAAPYGSYVSGAKIYLVESNVTFEDYNSKYLDKSLGQVDSSSGNTQSQNAYSVVVATWSQTQVIVETDDSQVEASNNTTLSMTTQKINYQDFVKGYTMPFDYLWDLLVQSEDQDFVLDLADLVYNSDIQITVHDNLSVHTKKEIYHYDRREKVQTTHVEGSITYQPSGSGAANSGGTQIASFSKSSGFKPVEYPNPCSTTRTTITTTNTLDISLTKADVWMLKYTKEYEYQGTQNGEEQSGGAHSLDNVDYGDPEQIQEDRNGDGASTLQAQESALTSQGNTIVSGSVSTTCNVWHGVFEITEEITNKTDTTKYVASPAVVEEKTDKNSEEPNFVTILLKDGNQKAKHHLLGASEWLFDLLEGNEKTADLVDLTKYLFYKATGRDYGVTEFDFNVFVFNGVTGASGGLGLLSITTTTFTREEFIAAVQSYSAAISKGSGTQVFRDNAGVIYDVCVKNNINPVLCAAQAWQEQNWDDPNTSPYNYWGIAVYNGQNYGNSYSSMENAVQGYCNQINSQISGSMKSTYQARAAEFATVNNKFRGDMTTIYDVFSAYAYIGDGHTLQEEADYAAAYVEKIIQCATQIFGEGALVATTGAPSTSYSNADAYTKVANLFPNGIPQNEAELMPYLTTINVPATGKDGTKYTIAVQVHKAIAQDVYNACYAAQQEGFKVYEIGGYGSWRWSDNAGKAGGLPHSQHCYGLAVDINSTENGQFKNGRPTGNWFYDPGNNPYSIKPDSALVQSFKAAGWGWGGDWTSSKDYMHFSFCGT